MNKLLEIIDALGEDALIITNLDNAIIGYVERFGIPPIVLYNKRKIIEILMKDMSEEEAEEYFDYNIIGAYMGDNTPAFATLF